MPDYSPTPFDHAGKSLEVAMHADAGKVVQVIAPAWCDTMLVRFYEATQTPPTPRVTAGGWVGTGGTAGALIGVNAFPVETGEAIVLERREAVGTWTVDLACDEAAGVALVRFERAR